MLGNFDVSTFIARKTRMRTASNWTSALTVGFGIFSIDNGMLTPTSKAIASSALFLFTRLVSFLALHRQE